MCPVNKILANSPPVKRTDNARNVRRSRECKCWHYSYPLNAILTALKIVGMSHDLGLNVDPINWTILDTEKRRRRRLWWGVYMLDKW